MTLYELQQQIYDNKIRRSFNVINIDKEIVLMTEEYGELCDAFIKNDETEIIDALGDLMCYGLALSAMFQENSDMISNKNPYYQPKPVDMIGHLPYLGLTVGMIAKNFKKSNKKQVHEIDRKEEFVKYIGNLLGYCAEALRSIDQDPVKVVDIIIKNNLTRAHAGKM